MVSFQSAVANHKVSRRLGLVSQEVTPMVWDVMVAAAFVVVSVAVLACFAVKFLLTWLVKEASPRNLATPSV